MTQLLQQGTLNIGLTDSDSRLSDQTELTTVHIITLYSIIYIYLLSYNKKSYLLHQPDKLIKRNAAIVVLIYHSYQVLQFPLSWIPSKGRHDLPKFHRGDCTSTISVNRKILIVDYNQLPLFLTGRRKKISLCTPSEFLQTSFLSLSE